jgi:sec-independent protein translocase protein TatA
MPSWIGPWEIAIVLVLALLIFGPRKLPDLGQSLGRSITGFKKGLKETKDDVQAAIKEDVTAAPAAAAPAAAAPAAAATATASTATETAAAETTANAEKTES